MPLERASVFESVRLGPEVTYGTAVAATKMLLGTDITLGIKTENKTSRAKGARFTTINQQNKEWSTADIKQEVFTITDWCYVQAMALGSPDIATPGGGTLSRDMTWDVSAFNAITPKVYTIESGGSVRAKRASYFHVPELGVTFARDGVSASGMGVGQKVTDGITLTPGVNEVQTLTRSGAPSSGTFTAAFRGEKTAAVSYTAMPGSLQTALEALPNVGVGNITVTGTAGGAGPYTVTFLGPWASTNVPLLVIDGALLTPSGSYIPTETTPGAALASPTRTVVSGAQWDLFVDTTYAGLGTTKLTKTLEASWSIKDLHKQAWFANTTIPGWTDSYDNVPSTEVKFKLASDSTGMGYLANLRAGDIIFPRIKAVGSLIEGALYNTAQYDFAMTITDVDDSSDSDGLMAVEWTGEIGLDPTSGKSFVSLIRSTLTSVL